MRSTDEISTSGGSFDNEIGQVVKVAALVAEGFECGMCLSNEFLGFPAGGFNPGLGGGSWVGAVAYKAATGADETAEAFADGGWRSPMIAFVVQVPGGVAPPAKDSDGDGYLDAL